MSTELRSGLPLLSRLSTAVLYTAGAGLVAMTTIVAWQVFCRYVLNDSPSWTEPGAVILMSWFIFLGAAVGVRENNHMGFDVLLYLLPPTGKKWLRMISDIVIFSFGLGMMWYGGNLVGLTFATTLPALGISGAWDYVPLIGGGFLIALFSIERIAIRALGAPIDEALDEMAPTEIAVELENITDIRRDAANLVRADARSHGKKD
ncbi:TRAP transporter small permease [Phyllobacterium zundukense]|jgi:TRAP-type C4-dicarboxylate transport system permease small subunit|uniref:TRAP transporter small permease n=1 Tax=Phyllobacterium zundukense TaxID=1867719 RepID=A0ACD4D5W9_9HYPH|nr:TRAP transporter small permease [Phyllobacterium zundukense]UXN61242.1 TRAP transporter small permease [Phyllobacterium zundukense]